MANLDRNRPFTVAWGIIADDEPFFFQDGKEFYGDGTPVVVEEVPVQAAAPQVSVAVKPTSLTDIAEGEANKKPKTEVKKPKVETKTAVAEPEEKVSDEVAHDIL